MGSLSASVKYERESNRLPPLDHERLTMMERRRVAANAAKLRRSTTRLMSAGQHAAHQAERRAAEVKSWAMMEENCAMSLRETRQTLSHSSSTSTLSRTRSAKARLTPEANEKRIKEALRETARDCVRRDELARRMERARTASELAFFRAEALEMERVEEKRQLELKQQEEANRVERKLAVEAGRLSRSVSFGHLREEERERIQQQENIKQAKIREEKDARAKAKEEQQRAKQIKKEQEEVARELANERRRKERAATNLQLTAVKAASLAAKAEACHMGAMAAEAKAKSDVVAEENRLHLLRSSGHITDASMETLFRLQRRLEMAHQRAESAGLAFRAIAYWAAHPDQPRPALDQPLPEDD